MKKSFQFRVLLMALFNEGTSFIMLAFVTAFILILNNGPIKQNPGNNLIVFILFAVIIIFWLIWYISAVKNCYKKLLNS